MEVLKLSVSTLDTCAARAAEVLRAGGVVLYPTDTLYGLGADAFSNEAVAKIYMVKSRDGGKPIHAIVSDIEMAGKYGEVTQQIRTLVERFGGDVTFVVRSRGVDTGIAKGIQTIGFRVPRNDFCTTLVHAFGGPVTATSANSSGGKPERSVEKILAQLGERAHRIDLVIDAGELPERKPSSVIDFSAAEPAILREAAISVEEIRSILGH